MIWLVSSDASTHTYGHKLLNTVSLFQLKGLEKGYFHWKLKIELFTIAMISPTL